MENTKEQKIIKQKKKNVKIFPIYKTVSWDLLFYFPIIFLFLTQVKGFTPAQVLFSDSFYTLSNTFWQLPITSVVDRIGKKNCLIIGNILYSLSILAIIFVQNFYELLMIQFVYALGYSIKCICETNILYDSLPVGKKRGTVFSKIDGKSSSYFYIFDAIASVIAGFTFVINGYIPMVLCLICCITATVISFKFRHTKIVEEKVESISLKTYYGQLKESFKFFLKSKRLKSLIIFNAILMGVIFGIVNLRSSMLSEMKVPEQYFGIVFALLQLSAAFMARKTDKIQKMFKNKTLTFIGLPVTLSCILIGFVGLDTLSKSSFILIFLLFLIQYALKGPFQALMARYLNNFTNRKIRPKITALKYLTSNLFTALVSMLCALMLGFTSTANTFIVVGCISTIFIVLLLDYMRGRVGLKPEQYGKEDLRYSLYRPDKKKSQKSH